MATLSSINTNFTIPTLPADANAQQSLEFLKGLMEFNIQFNAAKSGIETVGNAEGRATGTAPR